MLVARLSDRFKNQVASLAIDTNHVHKVAFVDCVLGQQSETSQFGMLRVILRAREVSRNVNFNAHLICKLSNYNV